MLVRTFNSRFELSHDSYNGIVAATDGKVYYILCSQSPDVGGQMYAYDPVTDTIAHLGDLTEASGEGNLHAIPQGKSHVPFFESAGKLYFATHVDYYTEQAGRERMGTPPQGYNPYPGGHFLAYDMATGEFTDLAKAPTEQGILAMIMDGRRNRLYGLTWPSGCFLRYDLAGRELRNLGPVSRDGEAGEGNSYRTLCRAMVVNPEDGNVYLTTANGDILRYRPEAEDLAVVEGENLRKDYFGLYDPCSPGHMGYNWRQALWHPLERAIYAIHGNSGYLFRFDPSVPRVDVLERLTSEPSRRSGMFDMFYYGYLGFDLGPDGRTLYYLTGGTIYENGRPKIARDAFAVGARGEENLHLITYDIPAARYTDHGPIFFENGRRPSYVNSIAIAQDGTVYALSRIDDTGRTGTDLIQIRIPEGRA